MAFFFSKNVSLKFFFPSDTVNPYIFIRVNDLNVGICTHIYAHSHPKWRCNYYTEVTEIDKIVRYAQLYNYTNMVCCVIVVMDEHSCWKKHFVMLQDRYIGMLYLHIFIMYTRRQSEGVATVQRRPIYRAYIIIYPASGGQVATAVFTITSRAYVYTIYMYIISPAKIKA